MRTDNVPIHVAIIMDGNGRWAKEKNLPRIEGHKAGVEAVKRVLKAAKRIGIRILTLYTFSTENWRRPKREILGLFRLLERYIDKELKTLMENGIRLNIIGDVSLLPKRLKDKLEKAISYTANNKDFLLNLALNYGGRSEIVRAARSIAEEVSSGRMRPCEIDEDTFSKYLYTKDIPDPDLLIRTSGELRISNFLLWQLSYTELYFSRKYWPDFGSSDLRRAIYEFRTRRRRFGA